VYSEHSGALKISNTRPFRSCLHRGKLIQSMATLSKSNFENFKKHIAYC